MSQGITSSAAFSAAGATVADDRTVFQRARRDHIVGVLSFNKVPHDPTITKTRALALIDGIHASGRKLQIPLPGGGSAQMEIGNQPIMPPEITKSVQGNDSPVSVPAAAPRRAPTEEDMTVSARVVELKSVKFMALKYLAKAEGFDCPGGMSAVEKDDLCRNIALAEAQRGG